MGPKVSIIIVTFNAEKQIHSAVKSVIDQSYDNKELIIVDGASSDNTLEIIKNYADKAPYLKWISEPDKGVYDAMNKGINIASGEWLYFLGADDFILNSDVINSIFNYNLQDGFDLLYGNVIMSPKNKIYDGPFDRSKILLKNICHQAAFYKKSIHNTIGLYDINYKSLSDWHFNIKCFFNDKIEIKYIPQLIANFTTGGISKQNIDLDFFRRFLFPFSLQQLNSATLQKLNNIRFYDSWWRLLRNLRLHSETNLLSKLATNENNPKVIQNMFNLQQKVPFKALGNGFISKILMFLSYCRHLINRIF